MENSPQTKGSLNDLKNALESDDEETISSVCEEMKKKYDLTEQLREYDGTFDSGKHSIDSLSASLIPRDIPSSNLTAVRSTSNGNCFFNSLSLILVGNERISEQLRILVAIELHENAQWYGNSRSITHATGFEEQALSGDLENLFLTITSFNDVQKKPEGDRESIIKKVAIKTCELNEWASLIHFFAAASVIQRSLYSVYPEEEHHNLGDTRSIYHCCIKPRVLTDQHDRSELVFIMWSVASPFEDNFSPNHFVPLFTREEIDVEEGVKSPEEEEEGDDSQQMSTADDNDEKIPGELESHQWCSDEEHEETQEDKLLSERDHVWNSICKYIGHLSEDEILETRRQFCHCVDEIINAYKEKLREVHALKNKVKVWKDISKNQGRRIQELERMLASKVCDECGEKKMIEQLSSLTMQETKEGKNEIDGVQKQEKMKVNTKKRPHEDDELNEQDLYSEDSDYDGVYVYKCKHASCGYDALLFMFFKIKMNFCPFKFIQMIGKVTKTRNPTCTNVLDNVKDKEVRYLEKIYDKNIDEGEQKQILKEVKDEFAKSNQKAGILSYWTESYNHCVNIYQSRKGKIKIYDANRGVKYIENLTKVRYMELNVLICDEGGVPFIIKNWSGCHSRHCEKERKKHSKPGKSDVKFSEDSLKEQDQL